jgi:hypothetical protein
MDSDPDPDPDPAIFVIDLQDASKKLNTIFSAYYFLKVHLHQFSKIKSNEESQNSRKQGFSYYFCMMTEGSGAGAGSATLVVKFIFFLYYFWGIKAWVFTVTCHFFINALGIFIIFLR